MKNYIIVLESGKNDFSTSPLYIIKSSFLVKAENSELAYQAGRLRMFEECPLHMGHNPDYITIVDVNEI